MTEEAGMKRLQPKRFPKSVTRFSDKKRDLENPEPKGKALI
jgi:hypothetical protein